MGFGGIYSSIFIVPDPWPDCEHHARFDSRSGHAYLDGFSPTKKELCHDSLTRRSFLGTAGVLAGSALAASDGVAQPAPSDKIKILGISGSPRKGKTTAESVKVCLEAAKAVSPRIEIELLDLAGLKIPAEVAAGIPLEPGQADDFPALIPKLSAPEVRGIIFGTPTHFGCMSALLKAFLDRCTILRKNNYALAGRVAGVVAVGSARNGGQELAIQSVLNVIMCQEMFIVGDGRPTSHRGATMWQSKDSIAGDEWGQGTAKNLGRRMAEVVLQLAGAAKA